MCASVVVTFRASQQRFGCKHAKCFIVRLCEVLVGYGLDPSAAVTTDPPGPAVTMCSAAKLPGAARRPSSGQLAVWNQERASCWHFASECLRKGYSPVQITCMVNLI